ncbi:MAG: PorV/PorQ family protein [Ignavibacteriaceae bacterium]|nr:PorV/PorQ family protein [Ignavibacterium sp.]MCC6254923.1 PorV/PorQ family protein [Ignavibacteriaceae bacterium]HRN26662.1 PorV/PorQ family protein [Ignavibacteriaceae bacterium]HRP94061.1 PorV/PorQ family protein [Ignavibacteriaceae bacterium]HRQ54346.1 PorV/PorQ family protein [Ignavibacteriaceae bacterium]
MKYIITFLFIAISFSDIKPQLFPVLGGQRAGISTAQFLKIGVGGRATAMGDAFVAVANDVSALYWNPAGLTQFSENQVMFSHNQWVVDINHDFIGAVYHLDETNTFGVSVTSLSMDEMKVTTEYAPFGTGEYFGFSDLGISVSYSRKMTDQFSFGGTVRYIEESLDRLKMRGIMIDLGTYYWTGLGTSRFAVTVSNFGNDIAPDGEVVLVGNRTKSDWQSFSPPTMFRIGFAIEPYEDEQNKITTSIQLNHPNDNSENLSLGFEYVWNKMFYARGGYKINVDEQNYSFGAGVNVPVSIANISVDYAYANFTRLGSAHRFSIILGL